MARRTLLALLCCPLLALAACGGDDGADGGGGVATTSAPAATTEETAEETAGVCRKVDAPAPREEARLGEPSGTLARGKTHTATVTTNCGAFTITLDAKRAPKTAASFAHLAREGFYDGLTIHRIAPGFVIQGGDPRGDGTGGPGYSIEEAPPQDLRYAEGIVAMAKAGGEPPGTSGSQFYVVLGEDVGLPPEYALVGEVTAGMDVVQQIGELPLQSEDPQGAPPASPVVMERVEVASR